MADNLAVTPGTGATVAMDELVDATLGTVKVQFVKIMDGTLDSSNKAAVSANGLQVQQATAANLNATVVNAAGTAIMGKVGIDQTTPGTTNGVQVNAALPAGTNVIGHVIVDTAPSTAVTNAGTFAVQVSNANANGSATSANSAPVVVASDQAPIAVKGNTIVQAASSTITRPADTTAYASGDLVANSTTAASVTNLQFTTLARVSGGSGVIVGAQIQKSGPIVTNAAFRLHLFNTAPTYVTSGDNMAISTVVVASAKGYLGYVDITAMVGFSDVAWGSGAPDNSRGSIPYVATAQIIYGLLEARGAYTPVSGEVFTVSLDALQD